MELTLGLEEPVIDESDDRWRVVNHSHGITAKVLKTKMGVESDTFKDYYVYQLRVKGDELEGKVIIVKQNLSGVSRLRGWNILQVQRKHSVVTIVSLEPKTASYPGATLECGWFWEGEDCIYQNVTTDDGRSFPFGMTLDQWGVPEVIELKLAASEYWHRLQNAAGLDPYAPLAELNGMLQDWMQKACLDLIAAKERLAKFQVAKEQVEQILCSIMDSNPLVEHGRILALMKTGGAAGNLASVINEKLHDIADTLGIELGPGFTSRHKPRVRR